MYINKQLKDLIQEASKQKEDTVTISFKDTTYLVVKIGSEESQKRITEGNSILEKFLDLGVLLCRK